MPVAYKGVEYTKEQIDMLREWVNDCQWEDIEDASELSDIAILKGADRNLCGGLAAFDFGN